MKIMYTRCPSCRAEISFEPPANMETLPDGYKHRIKCPSCGVTIGVKINKIDTNPATLVGQAPAYNNPQTNFEPVYASTDVPTTTAKAKPEKRSGVGRNIIMMLMSLVFVAVGVVGFLIDAGTIKHSLFGLAMYDAILPWMFIVRDFASFKAMFADPAQLGMALQLVASAALLVFAGINFIVAFISACGKKYGRAWNLISSVIVGGLAIFAIFAPLIGSGLNIADYFKSIIAGKAFAVFVVAGLGLLQIIFGLCFTKSLVKKQKRA